MTAKDYIIDFFNTVFLLLLIVFFLFYVVLGGRLHIFSEMINILMPFSIYGLLFIVVMKVRTRSFIRYKKQEIIDETVAYAGTRDSRRDLYLRLGLPALLLFAALLDLHVGVIDFIQAAFILGLNLLWHRFLFRKSEAAGAEFSFTRRDRIGDELIVFAMPLIVLVFDIFNESYETIDVLKSLAVFAALYSWHLILFKK